MIEKILLDWQKKIYKPIYWLEGDEPFFIDQLIHYAEQHILLPDEKSFDSFTLYGKDIKWMDVKSVCKRYPIIATHQLVIIKEAQQLDDKIEKFESYLNAPSLTTILIVAYKNKKLDGRSKITKLIKDKHELLSTKKLYENQIPQWLTETAKQLKITVTPKANALLISFLGNDLNKIYNELDKLLINLNKDKIIDEEIVYNYIGISREFNVFELQDAIFKKDKQKIGRIINYIKNNPKNNPLIVIITQLFNAFSKLYLMQSIPVKDPKLLASKIGINQFFINDYLIGLQNYSNNMSIKKNLLVFYEYNLKMLGINSTNTEEGDLLTEMINKILIA